MRWLCNHIRQCFCSHEFDYQEHAKCLTSDGDFVRDGIAFSLLCKKCGYHRDGWRV